MQVVKSLVRMGRNNVTICLTSLMGNPDQLWKGMCGKEGNHTGSCLGNRPKYVSDIQPCDIGQLWSSQYAFQNYLFIYLFMAVLGLRFCARAFSSCGKRGPLFIAVRGPLTIAASLVAEHRLQTHRLSNCGSRAQSLRGMWDLPRPGLEPMSPALAGRFSTTAPPGKPLSMLLSTYHF